MWRRAGLAWLLVIIQVAREGSGQRAASSEQRPRPETGTQAKRRQAGAGQGSDRGLLAGCSGAALVSSVGARPLGPAGGAGDGPSAPLQRLFILLSVPPAQPGEAARQSGSKRFRVAPTGESVRGRPSLAAAAAAAAAAALCALLPAAQVRTQLPSTRLLFPSHSLSLPHSALVPHLTSPHLTSLTSPHLTSPHLTSPSLARPLTHSPTHSLTHSLTHPLTHSPTHSLTHSPQHHHFSLPCPPLHPSPITHYPPSPSLPPPPPPPPPPPALANSIPSCSSYATSACLPDFRCPSSGAPQTQGSHVSC
jgi:hypothetical protein